MAVRVWLCIYEHNYEFLCSKLKVFMPGLETRHQCTACILTCDQNILSIFSRRHSRRRQEYWVGVISEFSVLIYNHGKEYEIRSCCAHSMTWLHGWPHSKTYPNWKEICLMYCVHDILVCAIFRHIYDTHHIVLRISCRLMYSLLSYRYFL